MPKAKAEIDFDDVLTRIAEGESVSSIARSLGKNESSIRFRLIDDEALAARYARAREAQAHHYAERIADMGANVKDAAIDRVRMDALKWSAARILPKVYGDKTAVDHTSSDGSMAQADEASSAARLAAILAEAARIRAESEGK